MANGAVTPRVDAADSVGESPSFWKRHWQGKGRLVTAFWLIGVVGQILLSLINVLVIALAILVGYYDRESALVGYALLVGTLGTYPLWLIYAIYASVAIWRCAFNTSWSGWGYLARAWLILVLIVIVLPNPS